MSYHNIHILGDSAISSRTHHGPICLPCDSCTIFPPLPPALPVRCAAQVPSVRTLKEECRVEDKAGSVNVYLRRWSDQGQRQNREEVRQLPTFHGVTRKYVTMLRTTLNANEVRSLAGSKVACPVLQVRAIILFVQVCSLGI